MCVRACTRVNNSNSYFQVVFDIHIFFLFVPFFALLSARQYCSAHLYSSNFISTFLCGDALLFSFHSVWPSSLCVSVCSFFPFCLLFSTSTVCLIRAHIWQFIFLWPGVIFVVIGIVYSPISGFDFDFDVDIVVSVLYSIFPEMKWSCSRHECRIQNVAKHMHTVLLFLHCFAGSAHTPECVCVTLLWIIAGGCVFVHLHPPK